MLSKESKVLNFQRLLHIFKLQNTFKFCDHLFLFESTLYIRKGIKIGNDNINEDSGKISCYMFSVVKVCLLFSFKFSTLVLCRKVNMK